MKPTPACIALLSVCSFAHAATTFNGDSAAGLNLQTFQDGPGPSIVSTGGNPDAFLLLTPAVNIQNNYATFDRMDVGTSPSTAFSFQFRIDQLGGGGADGFGFSFYNTANYSSAGNLASPPYTAEDPSAVGILGIGFDTYGNAPPNDVGPTEGNYSEISLFFNGNLIRRIDDTRTLAIAPFDLKDGLWHTVTGIVDFDGATLSMNVDSTPIFTNLEVEGLTPFENRVGFAGRTGGANERVSIDNLNVTPIPEPSNSLLAFLVGTLIFRRKR